MVSSSENLAKALEHYLSAHDTLSAVQDSDEVTGRGEASDCGFQDTANDAWRAMRTALYEYRKRCSLKASERLVHQPQGPVRGYTGKGSIHGAAPGRVLPDDEINPPSSSEGEHRGD